MLPPGPRSFVAGLVAQCGQNGGVESEGREEHPDRGPRRGLFGSLSRGATGIVRTVAKEVAPGVVDAVDINEVVERVDIQGVVDRVDVQGLVDDLDVQILLDKIDLDALIKRIDLDAVLADIDVNALIDRIDMDRVLDRVDLERVIGRIDVDALLARADLDQVLASIDVNALIDRLDVDRVIEKVDVDAVVQRVDFDAIVRQTEVGSIVAHSTTSVLIKVLDVGRDQVVSARPAPSRWDRPHSAARPRNTARPGVALRSRVGRGAVVTVEAAAAVTLPAEPSSTQELERRRRESTYAGAVSRLIGYIIDIFIVTTSFAFGAAVFEYVVSTVLPVDVDLADVPIVSGIALGLWGFTYFTYSLASTGRTVGKAIVGTRVVRADGSDLRAGRAALRVLMMPLSFAIFGLGLLLILIRQDRRALHDLIADTCEVYSWRR